jgi:S-adenosylmethionine hydrolase
MARSQFSFEKRRKELDKKKKKEEKKAAKADRKAAEEAGEVFLEPVVTIDEFGNVVAIVPEAPAQDLPEDQPDS